MITMRAASGDGASMHAQSPLDLVVQLSLQVGGASALPLLFSHHTTCFSNSSYVLSSYTRDRYLGSRKIIHYVCHQQDAVACKACLTPLS